MVSDELERPPSPWLSIIAVVVVAAVIVSIVGAILSSILRLAITAAVIAAVAYLLWQALFGSRRR